MAKANANGHYGNGERLCLNMTEKIQVAQAIQAMPRNGDQMLMSDVALADFVQSELRRKGLTATVTPTNLRGIRKALGFRSRIDQSEMPGQARTHGPKGAFVPTPAVESEPSRPKLAQGRPPKKRRLAGYAKRVTKGSKWGIGGVPKLLMWTDERLIAVERALRDLGAHIPFVPKPADVLTRMPSDAISAPTTEEANAR